MLVAIAAIVLFVALALLTVGLRGRRADDHPLCRRCGYDLTGRPADADPRCPECGADLDRRRAVRVGHRVRRPTLVATGLLVLLPATVVLSVQIRAKTRWLADPANQPVWWLRYQAGRQSAGAAAAMRELTVRLYDGRLSDADAAPILDRGLAVQADPGVNGGRDLPFVHFLDSALACRRLDAARQQRYGRQAYAVALTVRPVVRPGDPLPFAVNTSNPSHSSTVLRLGIGDVRINGRPVGLRAGRRNEPLLRDDPRDLEEASSDVDQCRPPDVAADATRPLTLGRHTLTATVRMFVYWPSGEGGTRSGRHVTSDLSGPLDARTVPVSSDFVVCDAAHEPPLATTDPEAPAAVLAVQRIEASDPHSASIDATVTNPGVAIAFDVTVLPDRPGARALLAKDVLTCNPTGTSWQWSPTLIGSIGAAKRADVVFHPDLEAARDRLDLSPIWGEDVVVRGVPVRMAWLRDGHPRDDGR